MYHVLLVDECRCRRRRRRNGWTQGATAQEGEEEGHQTRIECWFVSETGCRAQEAAVAEEHWTSIAVLRRNIKVVFIRGSKNSKQTRNSPVLSGLRVI